MSRIPEHITARHKQGVEQLTFYGVPTSELDRDELLAMINVLTTELRETRHRFLVYMELVKCSVKRN